MERRDFFGGAVSLFTASQLSAQTPASAGDISIERAATGEPHKGKVLALITPHLDDGPSLACGTVTKLLKEGYTGYFIRTSNDEKDSYDLTLGETVAANERDTREFLKASGLKQAFDLSYRNHRMDDVARAEIRGRLIFLFRLLKVDTVFSFDPWGHYEENPDHYVTAQAVEAACVFASRLWGHLDFPEHFAVGLKPHSVTERYYFARGPQLVNRVVDIAPTLEMKLACLRSCRTMVSHAIKDLNASLAERNLRLPAFAGDETAAINEFTRLTVEHQGREVGEKYGLQYAEAFHYIGPDTWLSEYVSRHAVPL